jgi:hypothetical protein
MQQSQVREDVVCPAHPRYLVRVRISGRRNPVGWPIPSVGIVVKMLQGIFS